MKAFLALILALLFLPQAGRALMLNYSVSPDFSIEKQILAERETNTQDIQKIIPMNMVPTNNSTEVAHQILDNSLGHILERPEFQRTSIGKTARQVEDTLKTDIEIGGQKPGEIKHRFNLQMQAFQRMARVHYLGFVEAQLRFSLLVEKLEFEVFQKLNSDKDLILAHTQDNGITVQSISLRWHW